MKQVSAALLLASCWAIAGPACAVWSDDPLTNDAVCTATGNQTKPAIVPDGTGGTIVAWTDSRGADPDIYAQRFAANGTPLWEANGVQVCAHEGDQTSPRLTPDGSGGAYVTWGDLRNPGDDEDIYAQHISAVGATAWTTEGVPVCAGPGQQTQPEITAAAGGAIIAWLDKRDGHFDIYAQKVTSAGAESWQTSGVAVCAAPNDQIRMQIASDAADGAILAWVDQRTGNFDVYAQRLLENGTPSWTQNGDPVCTATVIQFLDPLKMLADGAGGAFVTWNDYRAGYSDIYAQRVNSSGSVQWTPNGAPVCMAPDYQYEPQLCSDGADGIIVTWYDERNYGQTSGDIYAQRLSGAGVPLWNADGTTVCKVAEYQFNPVAVPDGQGGAIIAWGDERSADNNHYAQRFNSAGSPLWATDGIPISLAPGNQDDPVIASDAAGGAVIAWHDPRGASLDIFAAHVTRYGTLGTDPGSIAELAGSWIAVETPQCKTGSAGTKCKFKATLSVRNEGDGLAGPFAVRCLVSADDSVSSDDLELKTWRIKKLTPGQSRSRKWSVKLPLNVSGSGKRIIAVLDSADSVNEPNEADNQPVALVP